MAIRAAVIGAGIAGLSCARTLRGAGWDVEVFEAEPTIGGRIGTMRLGSTSFDHGAQYVTPRLAGFQSYLADIGRKGYVAPWQPRGAFDPGEREHQPAWYVGSPGMSSLLRPLTEGLRIHTGHRVHTITRKGSTWQVWFENATSAGPFAAVAIATPAPQALLIAGSYGNFEDSLAVVRMAPCWSLQVHLDEPILGDQDIYGDLSETIRWISRNNTKPRRQSDTESLVIQSSPSWSRQTQEESPADIAETLWTECLSLLGRPTTKRPVAMHAHLWRYGFVEKPLGETCLFSTAHMLGIAGDWCRGRLAEHGFESGATLGRSFISAL